MKANRSCSALAVVAGLATTLAGGMMVSADIGGGSGRIVSPYRAGSVVTAAEVETVRKAAASARRVSGMPLANGERTLSGSGVGVLYMKGDAPSGQPVFELTGITDSGTTRTIDFSVVETIWVAKIENNVLSIDRVQLQVKVFPTVSAAQLLSLKPTYTQLRDEHEETVRIWMPLSNPRGELTFVSREADGASQVLARVRDVKPGTPIDFELGFFQWNGRREPAIWWATDSVTKDPAYPHVAIARK
jgi:hypothetical protein